MTNSCRTAIAVTVGLALSACATTETTREPDAIITKAARSSVETHTSTNDVNARTLITKDQNLASQPDLIAQNETLLYGAMTKFELMKFVEAVTNANLQGALETEAPLTIFAPNNQAIERALLGAENDNSELLKGHIISGAMDAAALTEAVRQNGGPVKFTSSAGTELTVHVLNDKVKISGPNNILATITQADMIQSNGVMHQINTVIK